MTADRMADHERGGRVPTRRGPNGALEADFQNGGRSYEAFIRDRHASCSGSGALTVQPTSEPLRLSVRVCPVGIRPWQCRPKEAEYPSHWEVSRVRATGEMKLPGGMVFLFQALAGEAVGLCEVADRIWRVSYRTSVLCFVDMRGHSPRVLSEEPWEVDGEEPED